MQELTDFDDPTPDLTEDERAILRTAGASEELLQVCTTNIDDLVRSDGHGVTRNSALKECKKYLRAWGTLTEEKADGFKHLGGSFFSALWDGDLFTAYRRADPNNAAILLDTFGVREINNHRSPHQNPVTA